jgi:hypothetical protein
MVTGYWWNEYGPVEFQNKDSKDAWFKDIVQSRFYDDVVQNSQIWDEFRNNYKKS